jgi:hypothetical protein
LNPNYVTTIKQDIDKLLIIGFIQYVEEATWLSPIVTTPPWDKCEDETHTPKNGKLESSGTPKKSELDFRGQNTLHWNVLDVIEKVLKCTCPKWPCMSHLDICNTNYGQRRAKSQIGNLTPDH